jgi:hypothetical protein
MVARTTGSHLPLDALLPEILKQSDGERTILSLDQTMRLVTIPFQQLSLDVVVIDSWNDGELSVWQLYKKLYGSCVMCHVSCGIGMLWFHTFRDLPKHMLEQLSSKNASKNTSTQITSYWKKEKLR